jgi:hypothetical protein
VGDPFCACVIVVVSDAPEFYHLLCEYLRDSQKWPGRNFGNLVCDSDLLPPSMS